MQSSELCNDSYRNRTADIVLQALTYDDSFEVAIAISNGREMGSEFSGARRPTD